MNLFIPHAFDYDQGRANYPPDWLHQPYWPYFHNYADYTRRSQLDECEDSHHVNKCACSTIPCYDGMGRTAPLFSGATNYQEIGKPVAWKNQTILINDYYTRIILELSDHHWDYNIADDQYLQNARIEGNELVIGPQRFRAIILPPITTLSRSTLQKLKEFHQAGGTILGIGLLPTASPEAGGNDAVIKTGIASIFGSAVGDKQVATGEQGRSNVGEAFYIEDSVNTLIATLDEHVTKDVHVTSGPAQHLFFEHRRKLQADYYWVVNDTDRKRINEVHFSARGIPEKWNALTGAREPLFYVNGPSGTDVRLNLDPWDAYYVVFHPLSGSPQDAALITTNAQTLDSVSREGELVKVHVSGPVAAAETFVELKSGTQVYRGKVSGSVAQPLTLSGEWLLQPQPSRVSVQYAKVADASAMKGEKVGWTAPGFDDTDWPNMWLNVEQSTVRHWQMIGPFPNTDSDGFAKAYPPELEFDPGKKYDGLSGQVGWENYNGNEPALARDDWNIWMKTVDGSFSDSGYIVKFDPKLFTSAQSWVVSYAHTYLYSPRDQHAQFIVAADNWSAIWLNHKQVFAQLRTPFWYELNDNWADRVSVDLHKGWNEVLMKVGKGRGTASGVYGFSFRVSDDNGNALSQVVASTSPGRVKRITRNKRRDALVSRPGASWLCRYCATNLSRFLSHAGQRSRYASER